MGDLDDVIVDEANDSPQHSQGVAKFLGQTGYSPKGVETRVTCHNRTICLTFRGFSPIASVAPILQR